MLTHGGEVDKHIRKQAEWVTREKRAAEGRQKRAHLVDASRCADVIVMPQVTGTCWFNSLLACIFYSDALRRAVLNADATKWHLETDPVKGMLFALFRNILANNYRFDGDAGVSNDTMTADGIQLMRLLKPEVLLLVLHAMDPSRYDFDPRVWEGHHSYLYTPQLLDVLGLDFAVLDATRNDADDDSYNPEYVLMHLDESKGRRLTNWKKHVELWNQSDGEKMRRVLAATSDVDAMNKRAYHRTLHEKDVIVVRRDSRGVHDESVGVSTQFRFDKRVKLDDTWYILDSISMSNVLRKKGQMGHQISAITCRGNYFVYNGLPMPSRRKMKNMPPMNWMKSRDPNKYVCLDSQQDHCTYLTHNNYYAAKNSGNMCFAFNSDTNIYFYVNEKYRKGALDYVSDRQRVDAASSAQKASKVFDFVENLLRVDGKSVASSADMRVYPSHRQREDKGKGRKGRKGRKGDTTQGRQ